MASKTLAVRGASGAGKKTLIGRLVFSCGGLGLEQLENLERRNRTSYPDVVRLFNEIGEKPSFWAPTAKIIVQGTADQAKASSADLRSLLAEDKWKPKERLVVVVNKMDAVDWLKPIFAEIAQAFQDIDIKQHGSRLRS
ncbi:hypothetical protein VTJ49DRAFT_270 [Mycothermus thermophilus]|uniref:Uncharacterized protein n=1 Tax=Humicola insolens TaxID=85995 RepID=A0ABR3VFS0_HUMIN